MLFKTLFKLLLIRPIKLFSKCYFLIFNFLILKLNNIKYSKFPKIKGKLILSNAGYCEFAENISFNSSIRSNFVGLSKPCTIAVEKNANLIIGNNTGFSGVSIYCSKSIKIGGNVNVGGNVSIWDTDFHPLEFMDRRNKNNENINRLPIIIEDDVFIGANSIILKGVTISARSIVGAGSVVSKSIPADEIWGSNPVKLIRKINRLSVL